MEVSRSYPRHLVKFCIFSHVLSFHLSPFICPVICPFIWSSFIKLSDGGFQCEFIRTFFCQNWKLYWKRKKILVALTTRLQGERKMVKVNSVSECLDIGTQHNACASGRIWCLWSEKIWRETLRVEQLPSKFKKEILMLSREDDQQDITILFSNKKIFCCHLSKHFIKPWLSRINYFEKTGKISLVI